MKSYIYLFFSLLLIASCSDEFLDIAPQGDLSEEALLSTEEGIEGILVAAYSVLNGQVGTGTDSYNAPASNWTFGDIISDDAYKGSSGVSDQEGMHLMETFRTNANIKDLSKKWEVLYEGVVRSNIAIRAIQNFEDWDENTKNQRLGEARFLRGHFYFDLKKIFHRFAYLDETPRSPDELKLISNRELSSEELWQKIEADFQFAANVLPDIQEQIGRVTKGATNAYLCKTYIFQQKWSEAISAADLVINSLAGYGLLENYGDLWLPEFNNNKESIFSIQHSINDGAARNGVNGNVGDRLNNLTGPYPRVYGFHTPSENLVRAYKTGDNGLPLFNTFNIQSVSITDRLDPRLDFAVGRPGIPFYDAGAYLETWTRGVYGVFATKKGLVPVNSGAMLDVFPWTNYQNYILIRFADVLLWKAEALAETGDLESARALVNQIRNRAKNGYVVQNLEGTAPAANYFIESYNTTWTDTGAARQAIRMERRLEFSMEGHRFFDLVRWGVADDMMNEYLSKEQQLRSYLVGAIFEKNKHEYFPIPQDQIDLSAGVLEQNQGY